MASSRIFIKGLPPTLSEDDFKKHFSKQYAITDAKLMPHRRIGYVGYRTPEEAAKAVKYFNKSFIRMAKIGVELARPVADGNLPGPQNHTMRGQAAKEARSSATTQSVQASANPLKRKRGELKDGPADAKLQEYLEVMQPPSKSKTWANEDGMRPAAETALDLETPQAVVADEVESDTEYQVVAKKSKRVDAPAKPSFARDIRTTNEGATADEAAPTEEQAMQAVPPVAAEEASHEATMADTAMSDADWLRSRTSRLLGLADAELGDEESASNPINQESVSVELLTEEPPPIMPSEVPEGNSGDVADHEEMDGEHQDGALAAIRSTARLFLRNLPYSVTEADLREHFVPFGDIEEVHVPLDSASGTAKGFAYVHFHKPEDAVEAFKQMDGKIFQGRLLHILPAAAKREIKLDEYAISKLPLKKQKQIQRKSEAASSTFNWNALYMSTDAVMSSISDRLGVSKSELLDPTSSDAAVKQAHAETHIIQETKSYFAQNGVDLDSFKKRERGDTAILVKNFPYGTEAEELRKMFEEHGQVRRLLMPPSGTIAIVEFAQANQARSAFSACAYRKMKDSILFLEKAPKNLFTGDAASTAKPTTVSATATSAPKLSTSDLLQGDSTDGTVDTTTLFVRNLNFSTTTERLTSAFKPLDGFLSARVKTKQDPKKPGQTLSMGFGFLEFRTKAQAQAALAAMDGYSLEGHKLLIKASHKGLDAAEERRKEDRAKRAAARTTKIIIKNLPFETTKKDVRALFSPYGQLRSVRVPKKFDSSARGFAFADFATPREAENAMDALSNTHLLGRKLVLEYAAADPEDAEAELERMQQKAGSQVNKMALQKLTGAGRKKFNASAAEELDQS
ncbi:Multiple RNA-binding domain-containing protein 1 [Coniosporium tulheliwenetii]|uniref:Multiple RNA-binding domain-containing protein 1 n=1 Tax=Coniosporium tulheliwenetii TaxID=3383036 RepID=A0ACC2ZFD3_9PEZI|nr:Multiple RNA-binding domain-containing protein 1 [Cladosporium sp. JES 115]